MLTVVLPASSRDSGYATGGDLMFTGAKINPKKLYGESNAAACPMAKQKGVSWYTSTTTTFVAIGPIPNSYGEFRGIRFDPVRMAPDAAQAFAARYPNRGVVYEVRLRLSPRPGVYSDMTHSFEKYAEVDNITIKDQAGAVLEPMRP